MSWWIVEPKDPLLVRDGRPFGGTNDRAMSVPFPPPSVGAGMVRTRIGFGARGQKDKKFALSVAQAKSVAVQGPLLGAYVGDAFSVLYPAPRDTVVFETGTLYRLTPTEEWTDGASSLPEGLLPVGGAVPLPKDKPDRNPHRFWAEARLQRWLDHPEDQATVPDDGSRGALSHEERVHVKINPATGTAEDGKLFSTDGLRLLEHVRGEAPRRQVLLMRCEDDRLLPGVVAYGGERRISVLSRATREPTLTAPKIAGRARVILLTPGIFKKGSIPETICGAKVVAAAVGRPEVISGWDVAARGPKRIRRMAPAGSVYWVELDDVENASAWAKKIHLQCISDEEQDRRDGFGLAAVGVWR